MMKIVSAAEMREIDRITTQTYGVPSLTLMENAGTAVARFTLRHYPGAERITVICGKGNNGGDGFVAARKLHEAERGVRVLVLASTDDIKGDAREMLKRLPLSPISVCSEDELNRYRNLFSESNVLIDAVFGTGFRPPFPSLMAKAIELIGQGNAPVISVDIPSGADADSFALEQPAACRSAAIVTFTALKPAIVFTALTRGPIAGAGIGSPQEAIRSELRLLWNAPSEILYQSRRLNSNKGLYGHVLVIGGSLGKSGAPAMASMGALRVGAGLVTAAVPKTILPVVAATLPELMTEPLDENAAGALSEFALNESMAKTLLNRKNVVALGPGLGQDQETVKAVRGFVAGCTVPLVIDADGLNAFAGQRKLLDGRKRPLVLTPHPGEMARLTGKSVKEIEANRIEIARTFAQEHRLVLVLKGWRTLIADPAGEIWVNTTGNPGLAKGGTGDVLTGMIAGLIAQHPDRMVDAVRCAVYLHGLAADMALSSQTEETMLASDVVAAVPSAIRNVRKSNDDFTWIQRGTQRE